MSNYRFETKQASSDSLTYLHFVQALILWTFSRILCSKAAVPNLFGTRDWFCGRWFFHGLGWGVGDGSGGNVSDGERR